MISRSEIKADLNKLNISDYTKNYWYFYTIIIDDMAIAKPGSSTVNILDRIYKYINKEHSNQKISNFNLIAVIEFVRSKSVKVAENFIKQNTDARFNVFINQPQQLEQYQLRNFYDEIKDYLVNFPFSSVSYINKNASEIIKNMIKLQKKSYLSTLYQSNNIDIKQKELNKTTSIKSYDNTRDGYIWINGHYRSGTYVNGYYRRDGTYVSGHYRNGCYVNGYYKRV